MNLDNMRMCSGIKISRNQNVRYDLLMSSCLARITGDCAKMFY